MFAALPKLDAYGDIVKHLVTEQNVEPTVKRENSVHTFSKLFSPWRRGNLTQKLRSLNKEEKSTVIQDFYKGEEAKLAEYNTTKSIRSIKANPLLDNHLVVHTFPLKPEDRGNTGMNNWMDLSNSTGEDLVNGLLDNPSSLCCSTVRLGEVHENYARVYAGFDCWGGGVRHKSKPTLYPFGVVIGEGEVLSAYRYDAGTILEPVSGLRRPKYDADTRDSSLQSNIKEALEYSLIKNPWLHTYTRHTGTSMMSELNELVIKGPVVKSLFINMDDPALLSESNRKRAWFSDSDSDMKNLKEFQDICSKFPNLPIKVVHQGKEFDMQFDKETGTVKSSTTSLLEMLEENRTMVLGKYYAFPEGTPFETIQMAQWATGSMHPKEEFAFLDERVFNFQEKTIPLEHYTTKDNNGKCPIHYAIETGRMHNIPRYILDSPELDTMKHPGFGDMTVRDTLKTFEKSVAQNVIHDAKVLSLDIVPLETPIALEYKDKQFLAVAKAPNGSYLITSPRGSAFEQKNTFGMLLSHNEVERLMVEQAVEIDV